MSGETKTVMLWPGTQAPLDHYPRLFARALADEGFTTTEFSIRSWRMGFAHADAMLVHWPEAAARGSNGFIRRITFVSWILTLFIFRLRGGRVAWVFHNAAPHDRGQAFLVSYFRLLAPLVDVLFSPSRVGLDTALGLYPRLQPKVAEVALVGKYPSPQLDRAEVETSTSSRPLLLSFGMIRRYKGLHTLISAMENIDADLLIVGKPLSDDYRDELDALSAPLDNVEVRFGYISDDELESLIVRSDAVVLSFSAILHSGSLVRARSAGLPVLAPDLGSLREYQALDPGIFLFDNPISTKDLESFVKTLGAQVPLDAKEFEWSEIGKVVARSLNAVLREKASTKEVHA